MSTNTRRWAVAVSVMGLLLAGASPARATDPDGISWAMAPCVTVGEMQPIAPPPFGSWHYNVLEGSVVQCGPVVEAGGFRIATYYSDSAIGVSPGYNVRLFASATVGAVRNFAAAAVTTDDGEYGVCVLAGENERVACYHVLVTNDVEGNFTDVLTPLAVNDPLVNKDVSMSPYTGVFGPTPGGSTNSGPRPACGSCF